MIKQVIKKFWCRDMKLYKRKDNCCGCAACAEQCPERAIRMVRDKEGFYYPKVDGSICIDCGKCEKVCPLKSYVAEECNNLYVGVQAKEDQHRYNSSSGGFFVILAQYIIAKRGTVYGAGYDRHMNVVHKKAVTLRQLEAIRRTKYVQSDMRGAYCRIEQDLQDGKWVLFCGTPCQARALMLFLKKEYERLIVIDLVCYGVPSPGIWQDYKGYLECLHKGKMTDFSFRDKRNADNGHMRSYIINEKEYVDSVYNDFFCKMYFRNRTIRPSCHQCKFCTTERCSDFTIGDFWGIEHVKSDMDDGRGTSMVIIHTDKAKKIWDEIREETRWIACERDDIMQPRLLKPTNAAKGRWRFMLLYKVLPFSVMVRLMNENPNPPAMLGRME